MTKNNISPENFDPSSDDEQTLAMPPAVSGKGPESAGTTIGPYQLLRILGEGGMGTVYLAEQTEPIKRQVALKVIKLGMDTREVVARFESERQTLAQMSHPNIAKVYDAGATEQGRPFFVMEYVDGVPLTEYCDNHRLNTKARLAIFMDICQAVHHAHQKGIIHRDLKPQNVLVEMHDGKPVAKVIDFGVAKATDQSTIGMTMFTQQGNIIGTPAYMSPEQAGVSALDIDSTTDVYSLGVMLYELLSGILPLDPRELKAAGWQGIQDKIRDHQPRHLGTQLMAMGDEATDLAAKRNTTVARLAKQCRHELDWITLRAMEKDRARRYQSASEFAADIKRYLANEPVLAHKPSVGYQMRKLMVRHKYRFGLTAGLVAVLAGFMVMTMVQSARVAHERDRANQEAATAEQVAEFMVGLFKVSDPDEARGNTVTAREILDKGALKITSDLQLQPAVRTRMMGVMGKVYSSLGLYDQAMPLLDDALEFALASPSRTQMNLGYLYTARGELAYVLADYEKAQNYFQRAMDFYTGSEEQNQFDILYTYQNIGLVLSDLGELEAAVEELEKAIAIGEEILDADDPAMANIYTTLSTVLLDLGDLEGAEDYCLEAIPIQEKTLGSDHPDLAISYSNLGTVLLYDGDFEGAKKQFEQALKIEDIVLAADHPDHAITLSNLGIVESRLGNYEAALACHEKAMAIDIKLLGPDHPGVAIGKINLGSVLHYLKEYDRAMENYQAALKIQENVLGAEHPDLSYTHYNIGALMVDLDDYSNAKTELLKALAIDEKLLGSDHPGLVVTIKKLASILHGLHDNEGAMALYERALSIQETALGPNHTKLTGTLKAMVKISRELGDNPRSEKLEKRVLDVEAAS